MEHWLKYLNKCTILGKDESFSSVISIYQSSTVFNYKEAAKEETETRKLKGNQYVTSVNKGNTSLTR